MSFFDFIGFAYDHQTVEKQAIGGTQALAATLAFYLSRLGLEVNFYTAGSQGYRLDGVNYLGFDHQPHTPDVAIVVGLLQPKLIEQLKGILGKCHFVLWWHGNRLDDAKTEWISDTFDRVVLVSKYALDKNTGRLPAEKAHLIPNFLPVLPALFEESARISTAPLKQPGLMAYIGAVSRGLEYLPHLFSRLREQGISFKVRIFSDMNLYYPGSPYVGEEPGFLRQCREDPNVEFVRKVGKAELFAQLKDVSILLQPNPFHESFCLTLIEAMWMEALCVSTNRAAIPETAGGYALLAQVQDPLSDEKLSPVDMESYFKLLVEAVCSYQVHSRNLGPQKRYVAETFDPNQAAQRWRSAFEAWLG